ncbi:homeobox protein knotted-1-like 2 isoform X1 [Prunus yedoensis var. nudiflora]|uniref:Homeobox protein knotted-1-like 2 isoform X1 n=1 Tax=Prunus yedoensis var. nudiflora TaxID=2094558 RepID=A0A314ZKX0_PRUYE|nr:homeobox protein knotted-1-like 2 isoform X1 [Prunus yedoensis var. nudiflora]
MEDNYNGDDDQNKGIVTVCAESQSDDGDVVGEELEQEVLKRTISGHPLYGLLMENHINCLKVGLGENIGEIGVTSTEKDNANTKLKAAAIPTSSDLDQFMEAYCDALNKLKEAIEDPIKETTSFITDMYAQLEDLSASKKPH